MTGRFLRLVASCSELSHNDLSSDGTESKPSGIDGLGPRLTNENRHPSVQVVRGSTNMDLSRGT